MLIPGAEDNFLKLQKKYILKVLNPKFMFDNHKLSDHCGFDKQHMIFTYFSYDTFPFCLGIINAKMFFKRYH